MTHVAKQFEHLKIQLEAIKSATNNFCEDNCIGRGGFGKVYKGELLLSSRQTIVAIKRFDPTFGQGNPEFWKEIITLSLYKHENIVSLVGFCDDGNDKILVYEYASRRSLDLYLNNNDLTWIDRLKICIGAARGLAYLHNPGGTQQRLLHRDIKSSNILLDENWNAKISDFGLSKFGPANQQYTFMISNTVGTIGYCDPLYIETGLLTKESDVYSFAVVLFEVLCGRLCISNTNGVHQSLTSLVRQYYRQNKINEITFGKIKDGMNPKSLETFTTIAYQCLKRDVQERPLMTDVVDKLESALKYQVMQPKEVRSKILKHLNKFVFGRLLDDQGQPNIKALEKLFNNIDNNLDGRLSYSEVRAMFLGMRLDEINLEAEDLVDLVMKDFDSSQTNEIDLSEFVAGIVKWVEEEKFSKIDAPITAPDS